MANFEHLKVGDKVTRMLGGIRMPMQVTEVTDKLVVCAAIQEDGSLFKGGWTFDRNSGVEEDEELRWGIKFGATGSYLTLDN